MVSFVQNDTPERCFESEIEISKEKKIIENSFRGLFIQTKVKYPVLTSCDGFHDASKIITRFAATKLIPKPPARVDIRNNLNYRGNSKN